MSKRLIYLDVLRGIAVLLVLGAHPPPIDPPAWQSTSIAWMSLPFGYWRVFGWTGVVLFFVLSGFLIGGLLFHEEQRTGGISLSRFYIRRLFKIWPPYLAWLIGVALYLRHYTSFLEPVHPQGFVWRMLWPNLLHIQNYVPGTPLEMWQLHAGHTWSLGVEEQFYLALPLLLLAVAAFARRQGSMALRHLPAILAAVIVSCIAARSYLAATGDVTAHAGNMAGAYTAWAATHLRIDALAVGVLLAYAVHNAPRQVERLQRWRLLLLVIGVEGFCFTVLPPQSWTMRIGPEYDYTAGLVLLTAGSAALVLWAWLKSRVSVPRGILGLPTRCLAFVGVRSYAIYLWHFPFMQFVGHRLGLRINQHPTPVTWMLTMIISTAFALLLGTLMYHAVEVPALALRNRLFPAGRTATAMVGAVSRPVRAGE